MPKIKDLKGKVFHRWTVIHQGEDRLLPSGQKRITWRCHCICGNEKDVPGTDLTKGFSKSCGCFMREKAVSDNTTHNLSDTKIYARWIDMHQRCYNANNARYKDWGGRGIRICDRWHKDNPEGFLNYYKDVLNLGIKPNQNYTLDRINNDRDYCPENVRLADKKTQRLNQRSYRVRMLTVNGITKCMKEWAIDFKIHSSNILYWLKRGKSFDWIHNYYSGDLFDGL